MRRFRMKMNCHRSPPSLEAGLTEQLDFDIFAQTNLEVEFTVLFSEVVNSTPVEAV